VTAHPSGIDETTGGVFVSAKPVSAKTVGGIATLYCFPNAMSPDGLGTKGTTTRFLAQMPGSRPLDVSAVIPNMACNLANIEVLVNPPPPPPGYVTESGTQPLLNKTLVNPADRTTTLVDGATIDWDMANGQLAFLTFTTQRQTRMLNNPTHSKAGKYTLIVTQTTPAGGQTITDFGSAYVAIEDVTLNQAANSVTILNCFSDGTRLLVSKHGNATSGAPAPTPAPTPAPSPPPAGSPITAAFAAGVNLSGMEVTSPRLVRYGASNYPNRNYTVPRAATIAYLASQGITKVRLPIAWELLQPIRASSPANAAVVAAYNSSLGAHVKGGFWEPYAAYITKVLDAAQAAGIKVLLDVHNYARYNDFVYQADGSVLGLVDPADDLLPPHVNGDTAQVTSTIFAKVNPKLTVADFVDLWTRIATRWKDHAGLGAYGLMNEPSQMPAVGKNFGVNEYPAGYPSPDFTQDYTILPVYQQAAVNAIRSLDGTKPIYVSGNEWSTCINYSTINPGYPLSGNNLVYEVHVYPDASSAGSRFDYDAELAHALLRRRDAVQHGHSHHHRAHAPGAGGLVGRGARQPAAGRGRVRHPRGSQARRHAGRPALARRRRRRLGVHEGAEHGGLPLDGWRPLDHARLPGLPHAQAAPGQDGQPDHGRLAARRSGHQQRRGVR
jgi:aryl-phospho-beta-D-glucosidase BglC (GH1 family)